MHTAFEPGAMPLASRVPRATWVSALVASCIFLACGCSSAESPGSGSWLLERAPLSVDVRLRRDFGVAVSKAHGAVAIVLNMAALAAAIFVVARHEADFSWFVIAYMGSLFGSMLLDIVLSPFVMAGSVVPIVALNVLLIMSCCSVPVGRACVVALLYQAYQLVYILVLREIVLR